MQIVNTHGYHCVRIRHHSDEKIQEDDNIDHRVRAEHEQAPEASVALNAS